MNALVTHGSSLLGFELIKALNGAGHHCIAKQFQVAIPANLSCTVIWANLGGPDLVNFLFYKLSGAIHLPEMTWVELLLSIASPLMSTNHINTAP